MNGFGEIIWTDLKGVVEKHFIGEASAGGMEGRGQLSFKDHHGGLANYIG